MLSVTRQSFHSLYQGSELVVAGRLPPHSSPLTVTAVITALTANGNTTYLAQVIRTCYTFIHNIIINAATTISWTYTDLFDLDGKQRFNKK